MARWYSLFIVLFFSNILFADIVIINSFQNFGSGSATCPSSLKAYYRFEDGALTTDSEGTNTLTNNGSIVANTTDYKEGSASADFERSGADDYFNITDSNLDTGFPLKSGENNENMTIFGWIRLESNGNAMNIVGKYNSTYGTRSWKVTIGSDNKIYLYGGYNSGSAYETSSGHASTLSTETWYGVSITLDSDNNYRIRLYDNTASVLGSDITDTFSNDVSITTADLMIGAQGAGATPTYYYDGEIDKLVIYNEELTTDQIDDIAEATCPD